MDIRNSNLKIENRILTHRANIQIIEYSGQALDILHTDVYFFSHCVDHTVGSKSLKTLMKSGKFEDFKKMWKSL